MTMKLMYITRNPEVAVIAQNAGVDRIFVDMEYIGKDMRQKGFDSVKNHHTVEDVKAIRKVLDKAELLVRVNPVHEAGSEYCSTEEEVEATVKAGADVIMLPYFKTAEEVRRFIKSVDGRCRTMLLLETPEAVENLDEILKVPGIDEIHIGLNDLSLGYHMKFMFELLCDGTVERICEKLKNANVFYGFGGIASLGKGMLPAELIIIEHYRLGSEMTILSRSFLNTEKVTDLGYINAYFKDEVKRIREFEKTIADGNAFEGNLDEIKRRVQMIIGG